MDTSAFQKYQCQSSLLILLEMIDNNKMPAHASVRQLLEETTVCDKWHHARLAPLRASYRNYLEKHGDSLTEYRIRNLECNTKDEFVALAAVEHYKYWTTIQIESCLNFQNWMYLHYKKIGQFPKIIK